MVLYYKPKPRKTQAEYFLEKAAEKDEAKQARTKDDLAINIGDQFRQIRLSKHLTQQQFARLLNLHQSALSRLENGNFLPKLSALKRLADRIGLQISITLRDTQG